MSSRRWLLVLGLALAVVGCRNLVQPGEPLPTGGVVRGVILGPEGNPLAGSRLTVENTRYASSAGVSDWGGFTDGLGGFEAEILGLGPFDVRVTPNPNTGLPESFRFLRVTFDREEPLVLRLPFERYAGQIEWAGEVPPLDLSSLRIDFVYEEIGWFHFLPLLPTPSGRLEGWLVPDQTYFLEASYFVGEQSLDYRWPQTMSLASGEEISLSIPAVGYDIETSLGGGTALATRVRVATLGTTRDFAANQITLVLETGAVPLRAFGFAEVSVVQMRPRSEAPFLAKDFYVDLSGPEVTLAADLGHHRLTVTVQSADGVPWVGATVQVSDVSSAQSVRTGSDGTSVMFLDSGSYLVKAGRVSGDYTVSAVVEISGDRQATLTLD